MVRALAIGLGLLGVARAAPVGFQPGEGMTFTLSVGPIEAGRARMSVGLPEPIDGRRLAAVHGEAHSASWLQLLARLDDDYKVTFDADALQPRKVVSVETGVRVRRIESAFDGARLDLEYNAPSTRVHQSRRLPGPARDPMCTLFALRAAALADGDAFDLLVLDGPALYRASAKVAGRESLARDGGAVRAIRVDIEAVRIRDDGARDAQVAARHISVWFSDDDLRLPYRISGDTDLGTAHIELTSYAPPPLAR